MSLVPESEKDVCPERELEPELLEFLFSVREYVKREAGSNPGVLALRAASCNARIDWSRTAPAPPSVRVRDLQIKETRMPARLYLASQQENSPLLIYLHGGGWMMLGLDTHDRLMRAYTFASGYNVLSLDYPLAPEVQFPDSLHMSIDAVEQVIANLDDYANGSGKVVIGGDSSGANLAVSINLQLGSSARNSVSGLLLNYGVFDSDLDRNSYRKFASLPYLLIRERMEFFWKNYCSRSFQRKDPRAAPLRLAEEKLALLPPVHMCIAAKDILVDENLLFAQKLRDAGVRVCSHVYERAAHGFLEAVNHSPLADEAVARTARWLKELKT